MDSPFLKKVPQKAKKYARKETSPIGEDECMQGLYYRPTGIRRPTKQLLNQKHRCQQNHKNTPHVTHSYRCFSYSFPVSVLEVAHFLLPVMDLDLVLHAFLASPIPLGLLLSEAVLVVTLLMSDMIHLCTLCRTNLIN